MSSQSYASQLGISASGPVTDYFHFVSETLSKQSQLLNSQGMRGTRGRQKNRSHKVLERVSGNIVLEPSITEIDKLLPWILGGTTTTGVTKVADTLPERVVTVDRVEKVSTYDGVTVARLTLEGSQGQALRWTLDLEGETETEAASGSFPSLTPATDNMFVFNESTLTLDSTARTPQRFRMVIDNVLDTERFFNSSTRTDIPATDRLITLDVTYPYTSDHSDLYDIAIAGISGSFAFTDGSSTYTWAFQNLKSAAPSREIPTRSEIMLNTQFQAFGDGSSNLEELTVTKS